MAERAERGCADFGGCSGVLDQRQQRRSEFGERELLNGGKCGDRDGGSFRSHQGGGSWSERIGGGLGFARGKGTPEAGDFVAAAGLRPVGEHFEGFDAEGFGGVGTRGEGGEGKGVRELAEAEVGVQRAAAERLM